jgi:hypothetical protein
MRGKPRQGRLLALNLLWRAKAVKLPSKGRAMLFKGELRGMILMKNGKAFNRAKEKQQGFLCEAKAFSQGFLRRQKGFLGPIGDDLPSLIPLLFALMIFFYVFTFTWNIFDQRSQAFDDAVSALRVGNTMKGNNYLRGVDAFMERCNEAQSIRSVKFMAGLLPLSTGPNQPFGGMDIETLEESFFRQGEVQFICTNTGLAESGPGLETQNLYIRSFPVALEFVNPEKGAFYVRPMLLVAVTWR